MPTTNQGLFQRKICEPKKREENKKCVPSFERTNCFLQRPSSTLIPMLDHINDICCFERLIRSY